MKAAAPEATQQQQEAGSDAMPGLHHDNNAPVATTAPAAVGEALGSGGAQKAGDPPAESGAASPKQTKEEGAPLAHGSAPSTALGRVGEGVKGEHGAGGTPGASAATSVERKATHATSNSSRPKAKAGAKGGVLGGIASKVPGASGMKDAKMSGGPAQIGKGPAPGQKHAEIYTYASKDMVYGLAWSIRRDKNFRLACGSFIEDYANRIEILSLDDERDETSQLQLAHPSLSFPHPFPATKVMFLPDVGTSRPDLLATSSDYLRIYNLSDTRDDGTSGVELKTVLNNSKNSEFCAPLTSFDWNEDDMSKVGTSSIDTTCTIWDIEKEVVDTQLIAHDREVYDIAWGGAGVFASVSADGSVRIFDLRDKEHSTIIYESPKPEVPLVRLGWNKQDPRYMATVLMDSSKVIILDIRFPTLPVAELQRHQASVNMLAWAPHSSCHICTAGDDSQALIWDLSSMSQPLDGGLDPILAYHAGAEINNLKWSSLQPDWVAIAFNNNVQVLRV